MVRYYNFNPKHLKPQAFDDDEELVLTDNSIVECVHCGSKLKYGSLSKHLRSIKCLSARGKDKSEYKEMESKSWGHKWVKCEFCAKQMRQRSLKNHHQTKGCKAVQEIINQRDDDEATIYIIN